MKRRREEWIEVINEISRYSYFFVVSFWLCGILGTFIFDYSNTHLHLHYYNDRQWQDERQKERMKWQYNNTIKLRREKWIEITRAEEQEH